MPNRHLLQGTSKHKNILQQHWHLLKIDSTLEETFQQNPMPSIS